MATWTEIGSYSGTTYISSTSGVLLINVTNFTIPAGNKGAFIRIDSEFTASGYHMEAAISINGVTKYASAYYGGLANSNGKITSMTFSNTNDKTGNFYVRGYYGNYTGVTGSGPGSYTYKIKVYQLNIPETIITRDLVMIAGRMVNDAATIPAAGATIKKSFWDAINAKLGNSITIDTTKPTVANLNSLLAKLDTFKGQSMWYILTSQIPT